MFRNMEWDCCYYLLLLLVVCLREIQNLTIAGGYHAKSKVEKGEWMCRNCNLSEVLRLKAFSF